MRKTAGILGLVTILAVSALLFDKPSTKELPHKRGAIVRLLIPTLLGQASCSGVVISPHYIATAAHCLRDSILPVEVRGTDNAPLGIYAKEGRANPQLDLAILVGDFSAFEPRPLVSNLSAINDLVHDILLVCGYPHNGRLTCIRATYKGPEEFFLSLNTAVYPGMSGGPVISARTGQVIATITAMQGDHALVAPSVEIFAALNLDESL